MTHFSHIPKKGIKNELSMLSIVRKFHRNPIQLSSTSFEIIQNLPTNNKCFYEWNGKKISYFIFSILSYKWQVRINTDNENPQVQVFFPTPDPIGLVCKKTRNLRRTCWLVCFNILSENSIVLRFQLEFSIVGKCETWNL